MKKVLFLAVVAMMATMNTTAQTSLTGRVYHHPNIMASMFAGKIDVDEDILKKFDIGWLQRKALKMYVSSAPELQKAKYEIQGNKVILIDGKDRDTLTLSADGKTLSGIYGKDTKYTLKRTK